MIRKGARGVRSILTEAGRGWIEHRAQRLGASLAFYSTLSLAPLTVFAIAAAGLYFGEGAARGEVVDHIEHLVGRQGANTIDSLLQNASDRDQGRIATIISLVLAIFGATGVCVELKDSLDTIWEVKRAPGLGLWEMVKGQLLAFTVVVGTGLVLVASLLLTALLTAVTSWLGQWLPAPVWTAYLLDVLVSFLVCTLVFALVFKLLPDVTVKWNDVWIGAVTTAILFLVGKFLIGIYIGSASVGSLYGAAGSMVVVLVWTYYTSQILFFGAELIRAYARLFRPYIDPSA